MLFICFQDELDRWHTNPTMGAVLEGPTEHYYAQNLDRAVVVDLKNKMKARATDREEPSSTILHSAMGSFSLNSTDQLPKSQMCIGVDQPETN